MERHFLGWDRPLLASSVDWLTQRYALDSSLSDVCVVVTARRAGRRLLERLAECAASFSPPKPLAPPRILTISELPEQLYRPADPLPVADELTCLLARCQSLRSFGASELNRWVADAPPADDLSGWMALAEDWQAVDQELSAQGLAIGDVPGKLAQWVDFIHQDRWDFLAQAQKRYEKHLADAGWTDLHRQRKRALDAQQFHSDQPLVLIGTLDLSRQLQQMLSLLDSPVASLVFAPETQAHRFDEFGSIRPPAWDEAVIPLRDEQWHLAARPSDQADAVLQAIQQVRHLHPTLSPDQVTIGLCDETMGAMLARRLEVAGVPVRLAVGDRLSASEPATFLRALIAFVSSSRWDDFSALIRHGDVEDWIGRQIGLPLAEQGAADWHTLLDRYLNDHIQGRISQSWLGNPDRIEPLVRVYQAVGLLLPADQRQARPLSDWAPVLSQMLERFYGQRRWHRQNPQDALAVQSLQAIGRQLQTIAAMASDSPLTPKVTFVQSVSVVLNRLAALSAVPVSSGHGLGAEGESGAGGVGGVGGEVELLGWMELALDDASVLVVTGVNEGHLPTSVTSDSLLPNEARKALGLRDNQLRYARDAAWLTMILHSRSTVGLIGGRWDASGDPLRPSRLVLAVEPPHLADRVLLAQGQSAASAPSLFFPDSSTPVFDEENLREPSDEVGRDGTEREAVKEVRAGGKGGKGGKGGEGGEGGWEVPYPLPGDRLGKLHVTAFRDYLACPYRFYLKHVLKLRPILEPATELDPANFGTLAHQVLQMLAEDGLDACDQADRVADALSDRLAKLMRDRYGDPLPTALAIQQQQLQERLIAVAHWQAEQAAAGWRIMSVEREMACPLSDGEIPFTVVGQIDRIDRHEVLGYRLIDYKTKDHAQTPQEVHGVAPQEDDESWNERKDSVRWADLQLPLYVHLVRSIGLLDLPELGYLQMPRQPKETGFVRADWSAQQIEDGISTARQIVQRIQAGIFWPPTYPAPDYSEDWASICQDRVIDRRLGSPDPALPGIMSATKPPE